MRFLRAVRVAAGEPTGVALEAADALGGGLVRGNANVAAGDAEGVAASAALVEGNAVPFGDGEGGGVGLGVGEGGIIFSHLCSGTVAPPISFTSVSQRA
ncbi:MAG: hypothetical protein ACM3KL_06675 [Alphaproteobacteria bacterium]